MYNLHQHIKNDTDSTDIVENDFFFFYLSHFDWPPRAQTPRAATEEIYFEHYISLQESILKDVVLL
jgi:hypothetical protein